MSKCKDLSVKSSKLISELSSKIGSNDAEWFVRTNQNESEFTTGIYKDIESKYGSVFAYKAIVNSLKNNSSGTKSNDISDNLKRSITLNNQSILGEYNKVGLELIGTKLENRTGISFITNSDIDEKGYFDPSNSIVHINIEKSTKDTVFHEFIHPMITVIKNNNKELYGNLMHELKTSEHGKKLIEQVKDSYDYLSEVEIWEEALVTFIGEESSKYVKKDGTHTKSFENLLQKLWDYISDTLNSLISDPKKKITIEDLLSMNDIRELTVLMNIDNEFDQSLKDEIDANYVFKNDSLSVTGDVTGDEIDTGLKFQKEPLDEEKKKKTILIEESKLHHSNKNLTGLSYSGLKNKGSAELGIDPIARCKKVFIFC